MMLSGTSGYSYIIVIMSPVRLLILAIGIEKTQLFRCIGTRLYDIIQSDVSFHWPVYNDWSAVGRWTYSLLNNSTQESFFGVEKENCCWRFRVIGRRWINSVTLNQDPNTQNADLTI